MPAARRRDELTAVGVTCGIGSMLVGARQAGFKVVGNIEWRKYYHRRDEQGRNTFTENFPGAFMELKVDDLTPAQLAAATGCTLAIGHPECGCFSQLNQNKSHLSDPTDIPLFVDLVKTLRPRFFVMDDLPKSFNAFPFSEYHDRLPDYDLFPEWVSNYHYGNTQKNRKRLFVVGSLKTERWVFRPGEEPHDHTVSEVIGDLDGSNGAVPNHDPHVRDVAASRGRDLTRRGERATWEEVSRHLMKKPEGHVIRYVAADGRVKSRMGANKGYWDAHAHVLDGSSPQFNAVTCYPYSIRERARIQGFPDDFVFYGTVLDDEGRWNHDRNVEMTKQTGKAMPVQFCRYVCRSIAAHVLGVPFECSDRRMLKANPYVDGAKRWYCQNVGYADQKGACGACWMKDGCDIRRDKYGLGTATAATMTAVGLKTDRVRPARVPAAVKPVAQPTSTLIPRVPLEVVRFDDRKAMRPVTSVEPVEVYDSAPPDDYHCRCHYCSGDRVVGELRRGDGTYYNRLDRRRYYDPSEHGPGGHLAKTPLHVARWAVQEYSSRGGRVLDPTAGAGTTLVEALVQGRHAAGVELQYRDVVTTNVRRHAVGGMTAAVGLGDARDLADFVKQVGWTYDLVVNNPPYFGDKSDVLKNNPRKGDYQYDPLLPNLGLLGENEEYWRTMTSIYLEAVQVLKPGGYFAVGVKDQMRAKQPDGLHQKFGDLLAGIGLNHEATAFLKHYPGTLHLHTYEQRTGVKPPLYQSILVFRKDG